MKKESLQNTYLIVVCVCSLSYQKRNRNKKRRKMRQLQSYFKELCSQDKLICTHVNVYLYINETRHCILYTNTFTIPVSMLAYQLT